MMFWLMLLGGATGALVGACVHTTEKGKQVNDNLEKGWDKWKNDVQHDLPWKDEKGQNKIGRNRHEILEK